MDYSFEKMEVWKKSSMLVKKFISQQTPFHHKRDLDLQIRFEEPLFLYPAILLRVAQGKQIRRKLDFINSHLVF